MNGVTNTSSNVTVTVDVVKAIPETSGTATLNQASGLEQTLLEIVLVADRRLISSIWLDMVNVARDVSLKLYYKIDGTNYRLFQENLWTILDEDGILVDGFAVSSSVKITATCDGLGVGSVNIPYLVI